MHCPRCGNQFSSGTAYCRTCGLSLDGVSEIVHGESASAPEITSQPNLKIMRLGGGIFILGVAFALITRILRGLELFPESYGLLVFLVFSTVAILTLGVGLLFPAKKYTKRKPAQSTAPSELDLVSGTPPLTARLNAASPAVNDIDFPKAGREPEKMPVGSVTEHTTRNLEN